MKRYSTELHHMDRIATTFIYTVLVATMVAIAWPA